MSSAVAPRNPSFAQQGTVDWVGLSNSTAQFSVGVLARLSKAGIDVFTLQMGRAICSDFPLTPSVQDGLTDAIQKLKKYGSYGDLVWFGFGIKHIVTDLAETEEGLTCVSLCAALSTLYENLYCAQVLRDLCKVRKAPESFTPALRQWRTLVTLCSGVLSQHRFSLCLQGFTALISPHLKKSSKLGFSTATVSSNLARAVLTMAQLSKGQLASVTFAGGLDCAWLAAFAEVILSLDIEIVGSFDMSIYRSRSDFVVQPQVKILIGDDTATGGQHSKNLSISKASLIKSGRTLFHPSPSPGSGVLRLRAPWAKILRATFHQALDRLLNGITGQQFAMFLYCASTFPELDRRHMKCKTILKHCYYSWETLVSPTLRQDKRSSGQNFLQFAVQQLPELKSWVRCDLSNLLPDEIEIKLLNALHVIKKTCSCSLETRMQNEVCLTGLAHTIFLFLRILLATTIEEQIHPSIPGLLHLYYQHAATCNNGPTGTRYSFEFQMIELVACVFSGSSIKNPIIDKTPGYMAIADENICVYRHIIEDPEASPTSIETYRVTRGYIAYAGTSYREIHFMIQDQSDSSFDSLHFVKSVSSNMIIDTVIEETDAEQALQIGFRVTYTDKNINHRRSLWLDFQCITRILETMMSSISISCGNCDALYNLKRAPSACHPWRNSLNQEVVLDAASVDMAQKALNDTKSRFDSVILMMGLASEIGEVQVHVIDRYLLLYLMVSNTKRVAYWELSALICPFTRCLTCLVEQYWEYIGYKEMKKYRGSITPFWMLSSGSLELVTTETNINKFSWTTPGCKAGEWIKPIHEDENSSDEDESNSNEDGKTSYEDENNSNEDENNSDEDKNNSDGHENNSVEDENNSDVNAQESTEPNQKHVQSNESVSIVQDANNQTRRHSI